MQSGINTSINTDAIRFMQEIRGQHAHLNKEIKIGGLMGCKGDAYQPDQGLSCTESMEFHSWQINELAAASPDFIIAQTIPCLEEAKGIALALEKTSILYFKVNLFRAKGKTSPPYPMPSPAFAGEGSGCIVHLRRCFT